MNLFRLAATLLALLLLAACAGPPMGAGNPCPANYKWDPVQRMCAAA